MFQQFCVNLFKVWVEVLTQRNDRIAEVQSELLKVSTADRERRFKLLVVDDEAEIREEQRRINQDHHTGFLGNKVPYHQTNGKRW